MIFKSIVLDENFNLPVTVVSLFVMRKGMQNAMFVYIIKIHAKKV